MEKTHGIFVAGARPTHCKFAADLANSVLIKNGYWGKKPPIHLKNPGEISQLVDEINLRLGKQHIVISSEQFSLFRPQDLAEFKLLFKDSGRWRSVVLH